MLDNGIDAPDRIPAIIPKEKLSPLLPKGYLSHSQIEMYRKCPKQYEFRYIRGISIPTNWFLLRGKLIHAALDYVNKQYINYGKCSNVGEESVSNFRDNLNFQEKRLDENERPKNKDKIYADFGKLINNYISNIKIIDPKYSEIEKVFYLDNIPILEYIDLIRKNDTIVDYKTVDNLKGKPVDLSLIKKHLNQLILYSLGVNLSNVQIMVINSEIAKGYEETEIYTIKNIHKENMLDIIKSTVCNIKSGNFPSDPDQEWRCSKKYCSFYDMCETKSVL
jgi:hypothetical protein